MIRTTAMPVDANANGDIFGGRPMSRMDPGDAVPALNLSHGRVVTVAVDAMVFRAPVNVGDSITCYARELSVGRTSMKIHPEVRCDPFHDRPSCLVTEGVFTYVAIDENRKPQPVVR